MATVSRNSKIQVLYSGAAGATPGDADLFNGEFAWAYGEKELYIGGNDKTDVTFVGAEILRSGDDPFGTGRADNNLATTQAIYDYVDTQLVAAAGVTTVEGVTGAVDIQSANEFLTISAGTHPDKSITFDIDTDGTIGLTASTKLGLLSNSVGGVHIQNDAVALGTKTTGDYVASLVAGNLIDLQNNSGESATPTIDVNLSELTTMSGTDAVGTDELVILDDGSQKRKPINQITLGLFNTANQIALGTDTTGNYVGQVTALTTSGISVGGIVGENMAASISLKNYTNLTNNTVMIWDDGNGQLSDAPMTVTGTNMNVTNDLNVGGTLDVDGNLIVRGNLTTLDVINVKVEDPMIFLGATNGSPSNFDIGFVGLHGGNTYTGLLRDADDGVFYLFDTSDNLETATSFTPGNAIVSELRAHIVAGTFS